MSSEHQLQLPDEMISILNDMPAGKNLNDRIKISIAIGLFSSQQVSLARAAYLAGVPLVDFMEILKDHGISCEEYTQNDLDMDMRTLKKLGLYDDE